MPDPLILAASANHAATLQEVYLPVLVMVVVSIGFGLFNLVASWFLGKRKPTAVKLEPYECGVPTIGSARVQVFVRFYLVALLFLLFDMEIVYVIAWALAVRQHADVPGFFAYSTVVMVIYMAILIVGLLYEWKKGALNWT